MPNPLAMSLIGTVRGDLHDIGKSLVATMLEGGGFEIVDLGVDVAPARFVEAVNTHQPHIVALSALLTTTMGAMKLTIDNCARQVCATTSKSLSAARPSPRNSPPTSVPMALAITRVER